MKRVKEGIIWYVEVTQSHPALCDPMAYIVPGVHQAVNTEVGSLSLLQEIFPGIEPSFPTMQADSLPDKPQGKPKNIGVSGLSLLQWIFLTHELNWSLPSGKPYTDIIVI